MHLAEAFANLQNESILCFEMDIEGRINSIIMGAALPAVLVILAVPYLTGLGTRRPHRNFSLTPSQGSGLGLLFVALAICAHACKVRGVRGYENHPAVR